MPKDKSDSSILEHLRSLATKDKEEFIPPDTAAAGKEQPKPVPQQPVAPPPEEKPKKVSFAELQPALPELGTTLCPVCKRRVVVFVTKTKRPFINCGFCSARVFYNGSGAIRLLKRQLKAIKKGPKP